MVEQGWTTPAGIQEHSKPKQKVKAGLEKLSVHCGKIPHNCSTAHACGHCCLGCSSGDKQDGTSAYLTDAASHGACIFTGRLLDVQQSIGTAPALAATGELAMHDVITTAPTLSEA